MKVDESFTELVGLRWSMLYRLAVLLVGPEDAENVTSEALVRAHGSWHDVRDEGSVDDHLKQLLADTAVRRDLPAVAAGVGLSAPLATLPPRSRFALVLRHYEVLSDQEIADVLGCSVGDVEAALAVAPADLDPAVLRDELAAAAEAVPVPPPPIESLLAQAHGAAGRRRRRTIGWAAAGAVALVGLLVLTSVLQRDGSDRHASLGPLRALPHSLRELPTGRPPLIGYAVGNTLRLGDGREVTLPEAPEALATTRSGVYLTLPSGRIERVEVPAGTTETVTDSSDGQLVSDPSGTRVAWVEAGSGRPSLVVGDVGSSGGALLSRARPFPGRSWCCDNPFVVNGMTGSGQLIASLPAEGLAWVWDTQRHLADGTDAPRIAGLGNGTVSQVTAGEVVVANASHYAAGRILDDGTFLVGYEIDARQVDFTDPGGERVVYVDQSGATHVLERTTRGHSRTPDNVRLQLPRLETGYNAIRWEDDNHILVDAFDDSVPHGVLARCDVESGDCEIAARFDGPHVLAR
jgi:DNA-directed RNA polymerase specialized sigma24 family protein